MADPPGTSRRVGEPNELETEQADGTRPDPVPSSRPSTAGSVSRAMVLVGQGVDGGEVEAAELGRRVRGPGRRSVVAPDAVDHQVDRARCRCPRPAGPCPCPPARRWRWGRRTTTAWSNPRASARPKCSTPAWVSMRTIEPRWAAHAAEGGGEQCGLRAEAPAPGPPDRAHHEQAHPVGADGASRSTTSAVSGLSRSMPPPPSPGRAPVFSSM